MDRQIDCTQTYDFTLATSFQSQLWSRKEFPVMQSIGFNGLFLDRCIRSRLLVLENVEWRSIDFDRPDVRLANKHSLARQAFAWLHH